MKPELQSPPATTGGSLCEIAREKKEGAAFVCPQCLMGSAVGCVEPGCPGEAGFCAAGELMPVELRMLQRLYCVSIRERLALEDALRVQENALSQLAVWYENGKKAGRSETHMLEEMTCLAASFAEEKKEAAAHG